MGKRETIVAYCRKQLGCAYCGQLTIVQTA